MGLEDFFEGTRVAGIARAFRGSFDGASGPVGDILDQIMQWGNHLTKNAAIKCLPIVLGNHKCGQNPEGRCGAQALVKCDSCGSYSCLAHARIDYGANATCALCVAEFCRMKGQQQRRPKEDERSKVAKAYRTIGVPDTASLDDITAAYRKLALRWHPDRAKTERSRQTREGKVKKYNEARDILVRHLESEKAA